jgi:uncharacterized protein (TIGR03435 family)
MKSLFGTEREFGKRALPAMAGIVAVTLPLALGVLHATELPRFDVASVKPTTPGPNGLITMGIEVFPGGRVSISAFSLKALVDIAFRLSAWQVSGGGDWTTKDEYTIEAKPSEEMQRSITDLRHTNWTIEDERLCEMLQALLIDRFQLKYHRETKTGDVYLLERSGKTLRLQPSQGTIKGWEANQDLGSWGDIGYAGRWSLYNISMPQVAKLGGDHYLHAPVLDRTGLSGQFDYRQAVEDDPDVRTSFQEMLSDVGLKLERSKGPVETLVIDSVEKPSAN